MSDKSGGVPAAKMYKLLDEYPGIDLEKTRARFDTLSKFFAELIEGYVSSVVDKYGEEDSWMSKEDHTKEILLHDPFIHNLLNRSIVYPPFRTDLVDDIDSIQLELDL